MNSSEREDGIYKQNLLDFCNKHCQNPHLDPTIQNILSNAIRLLETPEFSYNQDQRAETIIRLQLSDVTKNLSTRFDHMQTPPSIELATRNSTHPINNLTPMEVTPTNSQTSSPNGSIEEPDKKRMKEK